jgi:putative ABC transport system permease protein
MAQKLEGLSVLSLLAGAVSMLAATFIVFSTLSMGVTERQRTLAMLRAIGAYRAQLGVLVVGEGLLLAAIGIAVGVPLGLFWVKCLAWKYPDLFSAGIHPAWGGITFGTAGSLVAALLASFIPAWHAMRTSPLEAMSPLASPGATRFPWKSAVAGLLFVGIDPFVFLGPLNWILSHVGVNPASNIVRSVKFYSHFALGLPGTMIGFFLLAPAFVVVIDRVFSPLVAAVMGMRLALVRQQLMTGLWRAAGTCAALMVGLSVLVVMQTQGRSMLDSWQLPTKFPDLFIVSPFKPLDDEQFAKLSETPGIIKEQTMPLIVCVPGLGSGFFALAGAQLLPDATMFFGMDPDKAFKLMQLDFREGNPHDAEIMLKKGRHVVVTEEFMLLKGLHVGDQFPLWTPTGKHDYTVAGVVWSPGLDVMVGLYDLGKQMDQRTAASLFGTIDDAKEDFKAEGAEFVVANVAPDLQRDEAIRRLRTRLRAENLNAFDVRQVKYGITQAFNNLLTLVTVVPLAALAVASLGVTNTILASIRTRSWQFGVLRSIGVTRSQLLRLVAAEAVVLGLVGAALGLAAGFVLVADARGMYLATLGLNPPLSVPWRMIWFGTAAVFVVTMLASLGPAIGVSRREPLSLLQAGRAAA